MAFKSNDLFWINKIDPFVPETSLEIGNDGFSQVLQRSPEIKQRLIQTTLCGIKGQNVRYSCWNAE